MKKYKPQVLYVFLIFSLLFSCEQNVVFIEPLPPGINVITKIPDVFQGVFTCESDESIFYVEEKIIYKESFFPFITTVERINETEHCSILDGGMYLRGKEECIPFEYISEDTIQAKIYSQDTLWTVNPNQVMKLYDEQLYLNIKQLDHQWSTFVITPQQDKTLLWELIHIPNNLRSVEKVTSNFEQKKIKDDKQLQYLLDLSMDDFNNIFKNKYFVECDILTPYNNEIK